MRTARARRSVVPPHDALPAAGRTILRVLAVVALIAGIVVMHSLGLGHGPMATGHSGHSGPSAMAGTTEMVGMDATAAPHGLATADEVVAGSTDPGHGMAAMCLAVLPLLIILLARLLGFRVRALAHAVPRDGWGGFVPSNRAPPEHLRPSLLKLCILRT